MGSKVEPVVQVGSFYFGVISLEMARREDKVANAKLCLLLDAGNTKLEAVNKKLEDANNKLDKIHACSYSNMLFMSKVHLLAKINLCFNSYVLMSESYSVASKSSFVGSHRFPFKNISPPMKASSLR